MSPEMAGRVDDARRQQGGKRVRNMLVTPQGPLVRRQGSKFVRATKDNGPVRLATFKFSATETVCVQIGAGSFRFVQQCATLLLDAEPRAYVPPRNISVGGFGTADQITISAPHGLSTGDPIQLTGPIPFELTALRVYYAIVLSPTVIKVAATQDEALLGTFIPFLLDAGASGRMHFAYRRTDLARFSGHNFYVHLDFPLDTTPAGGSPASVTMAGIVVTHTSHGFVEGTAVVFSGSLLPPQIVPGRPYFVLNQTANTYNIADTIDGSGLAIPFAAGSGTAIRAPHWRQLEDDNTVVANGAVYEVPNDYTADELEELTWDTSFDVLTIAHPNHPLSELRRIDATTWEFVPLAFGQLLATPAAPTVTPTFGKVLTIDFVQRSGDIAEFKAGGAVANLSTVLWTGGGVLQDSAGTPNVYNGNNQFFTIQVVGSPDLFRLLEADSNQFVQIPAGVGFFVISGTVSLRPTTLSSELTSEYAVTALDENQLETSRSTSTSVTNNLFAEGAFNTIEWGAVAGAARYRVYRKENGLFAFIGEVEDTGAATLSFKDNNLEADFGRTVPLFDESLSGGDYPRAVAHFEQRRLFGGSRLFPQRVWGTRTGTEQDLSFHIPVQDDDRIVFDIASREAEVVTHLVPLAQLILLTSSAEYRVTPVNSDAITPTSVAVRPQSFIGASPVQPVIVNNTLVFAAARGGHLRELGFSSEVASFITGDLSLRAAHLFDRFTIKDLSLMKAPFPIVFAASSSGKLLGLTYAPEEQIGSWHVHETVNGSIESHTVLTEGDTDTLYLSVLRTINSTEVRYIECIEFGLPDTFADNYFVDCGVTFTNSTGSPVTTISGLLHLRGQTVSIFANGVVQPQKVVSDAGVVTLTTALPDGAVAHIGLPVVATVETLPLLSQLPAFGQGNTKNIDEVWVRVVDSARFQLGPAAGRLVPSTGLLPTQAETKQIPVLALPDWNQEGAVVIQQSDPLPLTVVSLTIRATAGG